MLVQDILLLLPKDAGKITLAIALVGTALGAGLWLLGSRFSRSMITLCLVSLGAVIGMRLPQWYGWKIEPWAVALGGVLVMGVFGYIFHRFWVALGLGMVLMAWTAIGIWVTINGNKPWNWPEYQAQMSAIDYLRCVYQQLPVDVTRILPCACGAALLSGLAGALIWPRLGMVLLYSMAGVLLLTGMGLLAAERLQPQWLERLPRQGRSQVGFLLGMVGVGALIQWYLAPSRKQAPKPAPPPETLAAKD